MPFTFSHPVAVLPLFRRMRHGLFVIALIIGSISPDLGYYVRAFGLATYAHSFLGSLVLCVPAGVGVCLVLVFWRKAIFFLLPSRHRQAWASLLESPVGWSPRFLLGMCFWVWVGALTHIVWDAFTHKSGWGVEFFPVLGESGVMFRGVELPWYYLLQQGSTVFGFLVLLGVYLRWVLLWKPEDVDRKGDLKRYGFWVGLVLVSLSVAVPFAMSYAARFEGFLAVRSLIFQAGVISGGVFAGLVVVSVLVSSVFFMKSAGKTVRGESRG